MAKPGLIAFCEFAISAPLKRKAIPKSHRRIRDEGEPVGNPAMAPGGLRNVVSD